MEDFTEAGEGPASEAHTIAHLGDVLQLGLAGGSGTCREGLAAAGRSGSPKSDPVGHVDGVLTASRSVSNSDPLIPGAGKEGRGGDG